MIWSEISYSCILFIIVNFFVTVYSVFLLWQGIVLAKIGIKAAATTLFTRESSTPTPTPNVSFLVLLMI